MNPELEPELDIARRLADIADEVTLPKYRAVDLVIETKPDATPVTEADQETERALRSLLAAERPDHGVIGEEFEPTAGAEWTWIIDPIDGTNNYIRGVPVWATLIALAYRRSVVVGVVSAPALQRRWWGALGLGAYVNEERITVSRVASIDDAQISFNALRDFRRHGGYDAMRQLTDRVSRVRGFGDFWSHMLVAEGAVDLAVEAVVKPWDLAALQIVVEEAGGRFTDMDGNPGYDGGNVISSNGLLHDEVLSYFSGALPIADDEAPAADDGH